MMEKVIHLPQYLCDNHQSRIVLGGGSFLDLQRNDLEKILLTAKDLGISRIDTAPCYGKSEKLLGQIISGDDYFRIKTKVCNPDGAKLTAALVNSSIEASLKSLGVKRVESLLLHELEVGQLEQNAIEAIANLKKSGIVERVGVSSDNESLVKFAELDLFDTFMATINLIDLANLETMNLLSQRDNTKIIAKRTLANGVWRKDLRFQILTQYRRIKNEIDLNDPKSYYFRNKTFTRAIDRDLTGNDYMNFAFSWNLRSEVLIGTRNHKHLMEFRDVELTKRLTPLEVEALVETWRLINRFDWKAQV